MTNIFDACRLGKLLLGVWCAVATAVADADPWEERGAVYTMSNSPSGNSVIVFERGPDGRLTPAGEHATGGLGLESGLGNQGALALDEEFGRPPWSASRPFMCESGAMTRRVRGRRISMADGGEVCVVSITGYAFRYTTPEPLRDVA